MTKLAHDDDQFDDFLASRDALSAGLKALPQPAPSADLDAAIMATIEAELAQEAIAKAQQSAAKKAADAATQVAATQTAKDSVLQHWERRLKQFWYFPVGVTAVLVASVTLHQSQSPDGIATNSSNAMHLDVAKVEVKKDAPTQDRPIAQASDVPQNSTVLMAPPQPKTAAERKLAKDRYAELAKAKTSLSKTLVAKQEHKTPSTNNGVQPSISVPVTVQANAPITASVAASAASPTTIASASQSQVDGSANRITVSAARARVADSLAATEPGKPTSPIQHVEITGSRILRTNVESSQAMQSLSQKQMEENQTIHAIPKPELYVHPELIAAQELKVNDERRNQDKSKTLASAPPAPEPPPRFVVEAKPAPGEIKAVQAVEAIKAIAPPAPIAAKALVPEAPQKPSDHKAIIADIEAKLGKGDTLGALQAWKRARDHHPDLVFPANLLERLKALESPSKPKLQP